MKITRIAAVGLITASLSIVGLAGCGGSDSSSAGSAADTAAAVDTTATADTTGAADGAELAQADLAAKANTICKDASAEISTISDALKDSDLPSLQDVTSKTAEATQALIDQLKALVPAADAADAYQAFITAEEANQTAAENLVSQLNSSTTYADAAAALDQAKTDLAASAADVKSAATAAGLTDCANLD